MLAFSKLTDPRSLGVKATRLALAAMVSLGWLAAPGRPHAACLCGYGDGRFTINQTITLDGSMADWVNVHADSDNNCCDGGMPDVPPQPDRDGPVQSTGRDLVHFAHTWTTTNVYVYTERVASSSNVQRFIYYADADNDGLMETGERVIVAQWKGANRDVKIYLGIYNSSAPGGDPMVDVDGHGDGYTLPGTATGFPAVGNPDYQGSWGSSDGLSMEWGVAWADLGTSPGTGYTFHTASTNSQPGASSFPEQIDDNLGGCGGGMGSLQWADLIFVPDRTLTPVPGGAVYAAHTLTNTGNGLDTFDFTSSSSGDFTPTVAYYHDVDGSGTYTPGDTTLADSDGDGTPDSGELGYGDSLRILIEYTLGGGDTGTATVQTTATSSFDPNYTDTVTDTLSLSPEILITKTVSAFWDPISGGTNPKAIPGAEVDFIITATNSGWGPSDSNTVVVTDSIPPNMELFVGDLGLPGSGPVEFEDGTTQSGLTCTFISLASTADDLTFFSSSGEFTPSPGGDGYDPDVLSIRVDLKGQFDAAAGGSTPGFTLRFRARVK
jgi:uncharacterized repeat protein (TIGR01451 family)